MGRLHIELRHLRPGPRPGIGDSGKCLRALHAQGAIGKAGIAQAMAEGPAQGFSGLVVVAVSGVEAFQVEGVFPFAIVGGRDAVLIPQGPALGQLPAGVGSPVEQVGNGLAPGLPRQAHIEDGPHLPLPGALHRAAAQQHHHSIGVGLCHGLYHLPLPFGQLHVLPVKALGLRLLWKAGKHDGNLGLPRRCGRLSQQRFGGLTLGAAAGGKGGIRQEV